MDLPKEFLSKLKLLSGDRYGDVVETYSLEREASFRVNTLKVSEEEAIRRLSEMGFEVERVETKNAYFLKNKTRREFTDLEEFVDGWFYLQSISSMLPVWSVETEIRQKLEDERFMVLDMCAAPGSKTTQLAALMEGKGEIVANDSNRERLYRLKDILRQYGVNNAFMQLGSGENLWRKYGPVFDLVLVDAPCSGEGRFSLKDPSSFSDWSYLKVERLAALQKKLLFAGVMCLKSGGTLVYSTCTLSPEEDEGVVDFILDKFDGAVEVEEVKVSGLIDDSQVFVPGVTEWFGKKYNDNVSKSARVLPNKLLEGFFVCKFHRN
jgi:16S rRNA (cytosine1407-C5)-methyltransferase